jgi:hypothetical protein
MDRDYFDQLARALAGHATRRRLGGLFLALGIGSSAGLGLAGIAAVEAKRRKRKKRKRKNKGKNNSACQPDCAGKTCGPDGCGGSCGVCVAPLFCQESAGQCVDDDGSCGVCPAGLACHDGQCCDPSCGSQVCGFSFCGGSCGSCPSDKPLCVNDGYACAPVPSMP